MRAPILLRKAERDVDQKHELGTDDARGDGRRPVRGRARDEQAGERHVHGPVEHQRRAVQHEHPEPEHGEEAMHVGDGAGFSARPNGRDFRTRPARTEAVRSTYAVRPLARARSQKVGSCLHDVLVTTCAGRLTTCTGPAAADVATGAAAAAAAAAAVAAETRAIWACRTFSSTR